MSTLFTPYHPQERAYDEMFDDSGGIRRGYSSVHTGMQALAPSEVRTRADYLSRTYVEQGVTFDVGGE